MTQEEALKAFEEMHEEIDKENWLFIGTINPKMVEHAIQALSIVRCKDCKHWQCDDDESYCDELGIFGTDMNSYCSFAKRKEE